MQSVFNNYANSYDSLYYDKNYELECNFIENIFNKYKNLQVSNVLDMGCGTGGHALPLAKRGYNVCGIDQSEKMLLHAKNKAIQANLDIDFIKADIKTIELNKKFDAVISMFAVISYQNKNKDLDKTFASIAKHLKPNGLLVFDAWHGPAVLTERPGEKVKEYAQGETRIIRLTQPDLKFLNNTVDIHFKVLTIKNHTLISEVNEMHTMRFLFAKEIEYYLEKAGLELIEFCPFMQLGSEPTEHTWDITTIAKKIQQ